MSKNKLLGHLKNVHSEIHVIRDGKNIILHEGDQVFLNDVFEHQVNNINIEKVDGEVIQIPLSENTLLNETFLTKIDFYNSSLEAEDHTEYPNDEIREVDNKEEMNSDESTPHQSLEIDSIISRTAEEFIASLDKNYTLLSTKYDGNDIIALTAIDNHGATVTKTIAVTVNPVNDTPRIDPIATQSVTEDGSKTITFHAHDIDTGDRLTPSVTATHGSATINANGDIVFTPDANYNGPATVVLSVTDGTDITSQTINMNVTPKNDAPVITPITPTSATEDGAVLQGSISATDIDSGDTQTFTTKNPPAGFTLHSDGSYSFDPSNAAYQHLAQGEPLVISIPVTVTDSAGASDTKTLTFNLTGTNDTPTLSTPVTTSVDEDGQKTISFQTNDVDTKDILSTTATSAQGTVTVSNGQIVYTPNANFNGTDTITVVTTDNNGASVTKTIAVTVNPVNDTPRIDPIATQSVTEDGSKTITFHAHDIDTGDRLTPSVTATHGSATINANGDIVFTPDANYNGPATVVLSVTDGTDITSQTINMNVTPKNDAPVITPITPTSATEDGAVLQGSISATDIDSGDTQTFTTKNPPAGFTLHSDGSYSFDPSNAAYQHLAQGEPLVISIPVTVTDSAGASDTKTLTFNLTGTNDAPVVSSSVTLAAGTEDTDLTLTAAQLLAHASDVDTGETAQLSVHNLQADHGTITDNQDGTFTFHPEANYNGAVSFTYDVQDSHGATVATSASMNLAAVDDAAVITGTGRLTF